MTGQINDLSDLVSAEASLIQNQMIIMKWNKRLLILPQTVPVSLPKCKQELRPGAW